jgi:hypothetical protein
VPFKSTEKYRQTTKGTFPWRPVIPNAEGVSLDTVFAKSVDLAGTAKAVAAWVGRIGISRRALLAGSA